MTPEQTHATRQAENYRAAEAKIREHIKTFDGKKLTPADKKHVREMERNADRNRTKARNWQATADGAAR